FLSFFISRHKNRTPCKSRSGVTDFVPVNGDATSWHRSLWTCHTHVMFAFGKTTTLLFYPTGGGTLKCLQVSRPAVLSGASLLPLTSGSKGSVK
ncbi:hypothetical protein, partial [Pseudomonas sp. KCJK8993]|uniref:hypothetical protein n=1 Tax=Pseudomonas sp. KCJK8993 TaxID=3344565 RepID=UPI0039068809